MVERGPAQLVDADGEFCLEAMDAFSKSSGLLAASLQYQIVAVMGPQSSGKSTLMNHVFSTGFVEMDAVLGRRQTTRGIWMATSPKAGDALTVVLDLEGTDGRERGEDDTTFERQSALFALAVSDVVLINIWCHDIGREHGSGKPLIKTILQVNLKLFTPSPSSKKTVLVFVIRDKSKTPLEKLADVLEQDMLKIWDSIVKPERYQEASFHDFFEVSFEALPNFEEKEEEFEVEAGRMYQKFTVPDEENSYVRLKGKLPGDAIPLSMSKVWEVIKSHKDLDLPAHKIMVATTRCSQIQHEQLEGLFGDQTWQDLAKEAAEKLVDDFGSRASALVDSCILGYDEDTMFFDAEIRAEKREELVEKVTNVVKGLFEQQMKYLHQQLADEMKQELKIQTTVNNKGFSVSATAGKIAAVDAHTQKAKLLKITALEIPSEHFATAFVAAIDGYIAQLINEKRAAVVLSAEELFAMELSLPAVSHFKAAPRDLWAKAQQIVRAALQAATGLIEQSLQGYDLTVDERKSLDTEIHQLAMRQMKVHAKEAANIVLIIMKEKFANYFYKDEQKMTRTWTGKDNIAKIATNSRLASADFLAQLAIYQLEECPEDASIVESAIRKMAKNEFGTDENQPTTVDNGKMDIGIAVKWPNVPEDKVLLQPPAVRINWQNFVSETEQQIAQATLTQQANRLANNRMPPIWALFAMLLLGFNEFMAVVYSPILALALIVLVLFIRSVYIEMDVDNEMQKGALPGAVSLAGKFMPSMKAVSSRTYESARHLVFPTETQSSSSTSILHSDTSELRHRNVSNDGEGSSEAGPSSVNESAKDK